MDGYYFLFCIFVQQLIDKAREYFGLSNLEKCNDVGGQLQVHSDDAFSHEQHNPSGYAGEISILIICVNMRI